MTTSVPDGFKATRAFWSSLSRQVGQPGGTHTLVQSYLSALSRTQEALRASLSRSPLGDAGADAPLQALFSEWGDAMQQRLLELQRLDGQLGDSAQGAYQALLGALGLALPQPSTTSLPFAPVLEAAFGGLADTLGLQLPRRLSEAVSEVMQAEQRQARALWQFQSLLLARWPQVTDLVLRKSAAQSNAVDGQALAPAELATLWAGVADEVSHDALHGPEGSEAMAACIRATTDVRRARLKLGVLVCEVLGLPTRAEMDAALREIQALRRDQRRRNAPASAPSARPAAARRRKAASRGSA